MSSFDGERQPYPVEKILSVAYNNPRIIPVIFAADDIVAVLVLLRSGKGYEVLYCVTGLMLPFLGFVVVDVYLGYGVMILIPADKEAVENAVVVADKRVVGSDSEPAEGAAAHVLGSLQWSPSSETAPLTSSFQSPVSLVLWFAQPAKNLPL